MTELVRLLRLTRPMRGRLVVAALAGAGAVGSGVALLAASGWLIARAAQHPNEQALAVAVVAVRTFGLSRGVLRYTERLASHDVAFRVLADVRTRLYTRLERLAPSGLRAHRSGDLLARLVSDVDSVQDLYVRGILPPLAAAAVGAGAAAAGIAVFAPGGVVLVAGLLLAGLALPALTAALGRRSGRRLADARGRLAADVTDALAGAPDLLAFGAAAAALARVEETDRSLADLARRSAFADGVGAGLGVLLSGLTVWGVLALGVAAVDRQALSRVPLAVVALLALASFEAVSPLPAAAAQISAVRRSSRRLFEVLDAPDPVTPTPTLRPLPSPPYVVELRDAWVRYADAEPWALAGVDLSLRPGRRVAVVGPSGAGKSTLSDVLLRFRELDRGSLTINGVAAKALDEDDWRRVVAGCTADPHVFATTLRENVLLARPGSTDAELDAVAARVHLLDWVRSLPMGWDTHVGARGAALSGGQRQRLALARAVLANPPVLVLDEPTAHVDPDTRSDVTRDLLEATTGRTTLLITHDLEGLEAVDEIIVLDSGRVVERGTHDELLRENGWYARASQALAHTA